ncbi:hypothetical protein K488DRAFT_54470 [Vararia minispora EC-137]|uniref:Uncharacterized protein n=1 Tax=Vararia minispora EC-137 TaxID=1314806 RepID=A0ACB8QEU1_9AGAM|nr:hypothetical protein K488DRAFT_54470 [Vararia minispora EC-137]
MDEPSDETAQFSYTLFDSRARLRDEFVSNPVLRGIGTWGHELDQGSLLYIQSIGVADSVLRQGFGSWLLQHIISNPIFPMPARRTLDFTNSSNTGFSYASFPWSVTCNFAFAWPTCLFSARKSEEEYKAGQAAAIGLFRKAGFRRVGNTHFFAYALADGSHPSRSLSADVDYNPEQSSGKPDDDSNITLPSLPTSVLLASLVEPEFTDSARRFPLHATLSIGNKTEAQIICILEQLSTDEELAHLHLKDLSVDGVTVLHIAADRGMPHVIDKLLQMGASIDLNTRSSQGFTPLDLLERQLRATREFLGTLQIAFAGHDAQFVLAKTKLLQAMGSENIPSSERLKWGCTCGECTGGWLSPRMRYQMKVQAEVNADMMLDSLESVGRSIRFKPLSEEDIDTYLGGWTDYLPPSVHERGITRPVIRGYAALLSSISLVLNLGEIPTPAAVYDQARLGGYIVESRTDWWAVTAFFDHGGMVEHALNYLLSVALDQGPCGDGDFLDAFGDEYDTFPECDNDIDYRMVRANLGIPPTIYGPLWRLSQFRPDDDVDDEDEEYDDDDDEDMEDGD